MTIDLHELEIRIAYQDETIEQLSQQLFAQSKVIDRLAERCRQLEDRVRRLAESGEGSGEDAPPPHY